MCFFDTHSHLTLSKNFSIEQQLNNARAAGVKYLLDPGLFLEDFAQRWEKLAHLKDVFLGIAVAPHHHERYVNNDALLQQDLDEIKSIVLQHNANAKKIVAFSEIGYEFFHFSEGYPWQKKLFDAQLDLAVALDLPVFLHLRNSSPEDSSRDAYESAYQLIKSKKGKVRGAVHCFNGNKAQAKNFLDLGFYLSFSGMVTFKGCNALRDVAKEIPLECMLSETDAPYLAPAPYRGQENQSAYLPFTNQCLADLHDISAKELGEILTKNAFKLLNI